MSLAGEIILRDVREELALLRVEVKVLRSVLDLGVSQKLSDLEARVKKLEDTPGHWEPM